MLLPAINGEALRVYERCRRFLADELGTYPSSETEAAYLAILRAGPASDQELGLARTEAAVVPPGRRRQPVQSDPNLLAAHTRSWDALLLWSLHVRSFSPIASTP